MKMLDTYPIGNAFANSVKAFTITSVNKSVGDFVRWSIGELVHDLVLDLVRTEVRNSVRTLVKSSTKKSVYENS